MKFKVRQAKEEQEKVLEFWLEKDDGDIKLHVSDDAGNHSTLLSIDYKERKLRLCKWVDRDLGLSLDEEGRIEMCD